MNRHDRRAMKATSKHLVAGMSWSQEMDPSDSNYALIKIRLPTQGMPPATYSGAAAADRLKRFVLAFSEGAAAAREEPCAE